MRALLLVIGLSIFPDCAQRSAEAPGPAGSAVGARGTTPKPTAAVRFETPRGTWIVNVEIARTEPERARGLMYRRDLARDAGMLFLFEDQADHTFWMHNTFLSLDLIFIDEDRSVVGVVANAEPQSDKTRGVGKPSKFVLEVLAGEAYAHAVGPGARAVFVGVPE